MARFLAAAALLAILAGCDGQQPLNFPNTDPDTTATEFPVPPGTENPTAAGAISRYEDRNDDGGGLVTAVSYDDVTNTFTVDNLAFDGPNVYNIDGDVPVLNGYVVYAADDTTPDFLTGTPIGQIVPYRAISGRSATLVSGQPRTNFAIVRTGGYNDFGFGGFVYGRAGGTIIPTTGQALFTGDYAGMRVFRIGGGLEYTTGDMAIAIDFEDFNANDAVRGTLYNRQAFTSTGALIVLDDDLNITDADERLVLPTVTFIVREGGFSLNAAGEMQSDLRSYAFNDDGTPIEYENGTFNGLLAGNTTSGDGGEIVGVIVMESEDPRIDNVIVQETGGFILTR